MRKNWMFSCAFAASVFFGANSLAHAYGTDNQEPASAGVAQATDAYDYYGNDAYSNNYIAGCPTTTCPTVCGPKWTVETEFLFLSPDLRNDSFLGTSSANLFIPGSYREETFDPRFDSFTYAPRITLARQFDNNWGISTRFWHLSDEQSSAATFNPLAVELVGASNSLNAYTTDLELTRNFQHYNGSKSLLSFGVRHAHWESGGSLSSVALVPGFLTNDVISSQTSAISSFNGTGLTLGFNNRRPINNNGLHLFSGLRGSVLWGDSRAEANAFTMVSPSLVGVSNSGVDRQVNYESESLFIGEANIGLQWEQRLARVPATAFFRVAGEFQWWTASGATAMADASAANVTFTGANSMAYASDTDMTLVGLSVGAGIAW